MIVLLLNVVGIAKGYTQDFIVGDLHYSVNEDGTSVTVLGHVDGTAASGVLTIPTNVTYEGQTYTVTVIGYQAFNQCGDLTSVTLPNTLTTINRKAFALCRGLTSITLPASLLSVGMGAFQNCSNIIYTNYEGTLEQWCAITWESLTSNPVCESHNLYINDEELTEIIIPETVSCVHDYAFWNCESITTLYVPSTVTSFGYHAFGGAFSIQQIMVEADNPNYDSRNGCNALIETNTNILFLGSGNTIIPNTVKAIGANAFYGCEGIESINIPVNTDSIHYSAFNACENLRWITVDIGNPVFNSRDDCNAIIETASNTLISGCKNTVIPESVSVIGKQAFAGHRGLQSIVIPSTVVSIEDNAFVRCELNHITSLAITPPSLGYYVFSDASCTTIVVPCGCVPAYEASAWHDYFPNIVEDCTTVSEDDENNIVVYPNPTNGQVRIEASNLRNIRIFDACGQQVQKDLSDSDIIECDLSSHKAGIYLIRIETASGIATKRVALTK